MYACFYSDRYSHGNRDCWSRESTFCNFLFREEKLIGFIPVTDKSVSCCHTINKIPFQFIDTPGFGDKFTDELQVAELGEALLYKRNFVPP